MTQCETLDTRTYRGANTRLEAIRGLHSIFAPPYPFFPLFELPAFLADPLPMPFPHPFPPFQLTNGSGERRTPLELSA